MAHIETVNPRFSRQREIVVPFGTKFRTDQDGTSVWNGHEYPIQRIVIEQVD